MQLTSKDLWEQLEIKCLETSKGIRNVDEILSIRLVNIVNHFNGNIARNKQYTCIESVEQVVSNLKREDYSKDRKYSVDQLKAIKDLNEGLVLILKVLKSEYRADVIREHEESKNEVVLERFPNINSERAADLHKIKDSARF